MAKQTGTYFIGRYGNVVGSTWKGIPYLRFQPDRIKQSKATRESVNYMALASPIAAAFRKAFEQIVPQPKSRQMQNSFNGAVKKWLQTKPFEQKLPSTKLPFINGFEFNQQSLLSDRLHLSITLQETKQEELFLNIPSFIPNKSIAAPAYTKQVSMHIVAALYDRRKKFITNSFETELNIAYNDVSFPAQQIELPYSVADNCTLLVAVSLTYTVTKTQTQVNDLRWLPCGIVCGLVS